MNDSKTRPSPRLGASALFLASLVFACGGSSGSSGTGGAGGTAPKNLVYGSNPVVYPQGLAISPNSPSVQGNVKAWSVTPPLPPGLTLDPATGTIQGTPTTAAVTLDYTVKASNSVGATKAKISLSVVVPSSFAITSSLDDDTLSVHVVDAGSGALRPWSYSTAVPGEEGVGRIVTSQDGTVVYAVNRDSDSISIYDLDLSVGRLEARAPVLTGLLPYEFLLHPDGDAAYLTLLGSGMVQAYSVAPGSGDLSPLGAPLNTSGAPRGLTINDEGTFLYVGNAVADSVQTFAIDALTRELSEAGADESTGITPLALVVTNDARHMFVVNAGSSSLGIYNLDLNTGLPLHLEDRFVGLLPTDVVLDPTSRFVYVAVSGQNLVRAYRFFPQFATLTEAGPAVPTGMQPSTLQIDATGRYLYAANTASGDVSRFEIDLQSGALTPVAGSNTRDAPLGFALLSGDTPAALTPEFAYVTNRGSGDLSMFSVDGQSGVLSSLGSRTLLGNSPRGLAADRWSRFLYTVDSDDDTLRSFTIQPNTGQLSEIGSALPTGAGPRAVCVDSSSRFLFAANFDAGSVSRYTLDLDTGVPTGAGTQMVGTNPIALSVDPTGRFLHVASQGSNDISTFRIDAVDGSLTEVSTPIPVATNPLALVAHPTGRFLLATFLDLGQLAIFNVDPASGMPSGAFSVASGVQPSSIAVAPLGRRAFVTNEDPGGMGELATFALAPLDAQPDAESTQLAGVNPVDAAFDPSGQFLYVAAAGSDQVHVFFVLDETQPPVHVGAWDVGVSPDSVVVTGSLAN